MKGFVFVPCVSANCVENDLESKSEVRNAVRDSYFQDLVIKSCQELK